MRQTAEPLLARVAATAAEKPERIALIQGEQRVSYEEFARRIAGVSHALRQEGVEPGDRVLISAANSAAVPIAYFAIHAARAVAVLVSPETPPASLDLIVQRASVRVALVDRDVQVSCKVADIDSIAGNAREFEAPHLDLDQPADLLFTTGTTGRKKGVLLSHRNAMAAGRNISEFLRVRPDDLQAVPLPLSHSFGLGCIRSLAWTGHAMLIERGLVNPAAMLRRMERVGATALALVPSGVDLVRRLTGDKLGSFRDRLRFVELGSAPISSELRTWLMEQLPQTRLCHHYGMTEASRAVFIEYHADRAKLATVGKASPNVALTILDAGGNPAPPGEEGEIAIAGDVVLARYWEDQELTRERLGPYGLASGDMGRIDSDGYLHLLGRQDDLINVGGRKVVPDEIEELLRSHPTVLDAVCTAVQDSILGQVVKASIVPRTGYDEDLLLEWLRPQLEDYKIPRIVRKISEVPRTSSGKIQRHLVRDVECL